MSSDNSSSDEESEKTTDKGLNLAGFLFGNIDQDGKLEDSFLDETSKNKLGGLSSVLGLKNIIEEETKDEKQADEDYEAGSKNPDAEDFSAIKDALTDDSTSEEEDEPEIKKEAPEQSKSSPEPKKETPAEVEKKPKEPTPEIKPEIKEEPQDETKLMPPPSATPAASSAPTPSSSSPPKVPPGPVKKPLASMLPKKYKNVDVKELFPEFRENKVLRFSRLFPIKASYKPRIWKNVKRRFKTEEGSGEPESPPKMAKGEWTLNFAPPPTDPDAYVEDQAVRFHRPFQAKKREEEVKANKVNQSRGPQATDWRNGPAQYWYDMLGLPEKVEDFDYGMKKHEENVQPEPVQAENKDQVENKIPDDAFLMVTQANWEEDVIWNGDDVRHKVLQKLNSKTNAAGWVPSSFNRTAGSMTGKLTSIKPQTMHLKRPRQDEEFFSIFSVENEELAYGRWEDQVIWDHEKMPVKLEPKMVTVDPNDDNIILGIPEDIDPATLPQEGPIKKVKIIQKHVKKSRMMLNRSGIINVIEEESPPPPPKVVDKDPYNMSNDEFYTPKTHESQIKVTSGEFLQHATPVVELRAPFVPTFIGAPKLRLFHRGPLKRYSHGVLANIGNYHGVNPLMKHMKKRAKEREKEREEAGGGEIFFMRTPEDTSGKDGEILLMEFMEEYPPLLSLTGMCSKIKNYFKRKPGTDSNEEAAKLPYGELNLAHTSPFLGQMSPGQTIQAMENNMFRAPIYEQDVPTTDFLVIRTRNEFSVREVNGLYTVGQECPLYEVPGPNSKKANNFTRDFLQVFIYRLFWSSQNNPRRIKMDVIKKAFEAHSESSIRKRLKPCAEFHRTGADSNWWVVKHNFRLPTEDEIRSMVSPEQCCAYFSMIAAEQRLKDAGYGEKSIIAQQDDDDEETSMKLDVEVQVAPWNTTRAYILAMKGKCLLQLTGPADPTGPAAEGFSYVRIPNKPTNKEEAEQQPKRTVTGTDADLRKLPLKEARAILRQNGVPEEEIKRLSRWEVIDVVRTLSTEKVKAGDDGDHKFSRGNRFSIAEHQERYREECQRIFDTQNKVLGSDEVLSSDDASSSEDERDDDLDEMGRSLETLLSNKKSSSQLRREQEEKERKNLQKMIMDHGSKKDTNKNDEKPDEDDGPPQVLKITRTYRDSDGKERVRTEYVRNKPIVIQTYVKIRQTKDAEFIKQFATLDDAAKEEMKKEKRRIQEQLRRIKRNQEKDRIRLQEQEAKQAAKLAKLAAKGKHPDKVKCGACGAQGHMKTNRACPKFNPNDPELLGLGPINVALTEKDEEELEKRIIDIENEDEGLVSVDGTKMTLKSKLLDQVEEVRRRSLKIQVPKEILKAQKGRKRAGTVEHCDYLSKPSYKKRARVRTDHVTTLASFLDDVWKELKNMDEAAQFRQPVNTKLVVDYLDKIDIPMDLSVIKASIDDHKYQSREGFLTDIAQIVKNSQIYNGDDDKITREAKMLMEKVVNKFSENEDTLQELEKKINPLLDENEQVKFSFILESVLTKIMQMQDSWPFQKPVNRKQLKVYYEKIKEPMDLEKISGRVARYGYRGRAQFLRDMELIYNNSKQFNGEQSEYTAKAKRLLDFTKGQLYQAAHNDYYAELEAKIQEREIEGDVESLGTSMGELDESSRMSAQEAPIEKKDKKKAKPRKAKLNKSYNNLEDDLHYSSDDDNFGDFDDDEDEEDEDWQEVVEDQQQQPGFTVTVQDPSALYSEDASGQVQIQAPDLVIANPEEVLEEEQVDENYDPTDFLMGMGNMQNEEQPNDPSGGEIISDVTAAINEAVNNAQDHPGPETNTDDLIAEDLDISDDSDEEMAEDASAQEQPLQAPPQAQPPPPSEDANQPPNSEGDEDGIWF